MNKNENISFGVIIGLFIVSAVLSWSLYFKQYGQQDTIDIHEFPKEIAGWSSTEMTISEEEYAILETRNAFARKYSNNAGETVYLLIVYSQNNRKVSHPPEICYTGSGVDIVNNQPAVIDVAGEKLAIRANKLLLEKGDIQQVSYYWFKVGNSFTPNYWRQQMLIALKTILGKPASSALIRIAANVNDSGVNQAEERAEGFSRLVTPLLDNYLP